MGEFKAAAILGRHAQLDGMGLPDVYRLGRIAQQLDPAAVRSVTIPVGGGAAASARRRRRRPLRRLRRRRHAPSPLTERAFPPSADLYGPSRLDVRLLHLGTVAG